MLFGIRLISLDENAMRYQEQTRLLQQFAAEQKADALLRLALLLDFPPIADYESAMELLFRIWQQLKDDRAVIIGAYIGLAEMGNIPGKFHAQLPKCCADEKIKATGQYLLAMQAARQEKQKQAIILLEKSIQQYANTVWPYFELAKFCPSRRAALTGCAHRNIQRCYKESEIEQMTLTELIDPDRYINEILGLEITESLYDEFFGL